MSTQQEGVCAFHPEKRAVGTCSRCGNFHCEACFKELAGRRLCSACLELPAVNYLKATRDKFWGKRDGWVWYFGIFGGLGSIGGTVGAIATRDPLEASASLVSLGLFGAYFLLKTWARKALFLLPVLAVLRVLARLSQLPGQAPAYTAGVATGSALVLALFVVAAYQDSRNKLAFRVDLSDADLHKLHLRTSNTSASRAAAYSVLSLLVPFLGLLTLWLGVRSLRRVQANAWPPVGGKGPAIFGIVVSVLSVALWTLVAASALRS